MNRSLVATLALALGLAACGGSHETAGASGPGTMPMAVSAPAIVAIHIAGYYRGTLTNKLGTAKVEIALSQAGVSSSYGGSVEQRTPTRVRSAIALTGSAASLSGNVVMEGNAPCTFALSNVKYDTSTFTLTGTMTPVHRCTTFPKTTLRATEKCYYVIPNPTAIDRVRPDPAGMRAC
jgi:hypothetical protein